MKNKPLIFYLLILLPAGLFAQVSQAPLQNYISGGGSTGSFHPATSVPTHFSSVGQPAVYARPASTNNGGGIMNANELMFTTSTIDITPPVIISLTPPDDAISVATSSDLVITFNENIQKGTGNILVKKTSDNSTVQTIDIAGLNVTILNATLTIDTPTDLPGETGLYINIPSGAIKDLVASNIFPGIGDATTWNFTTAAAPDVSAPIISSLLPSDNATAVSVSSNLAITFNENIQKGTGNVLIKKTSDNSTVQTIDVAASNVTISNATLTIDPSTDFPEETDLYVNISSQAVKDLSSNNFAGIEDATTWNFSTASTQDTSPPIITDNTAGTVNEGASLTITANIIDSDSPITSAQVEYRSISVGGSNIIKNLDQSGSTYSTSLSASDIGELGIIYRISASSTGGTSSTGTNFKIVKVINSGLTIPYSSFGGSVSNYRIIAVPLELSAKSVLSVFDELGGVDKEKWRMFRYDNGNTSELSGSSQILPGQGFWLIVRNNPGSSINSGPGTSVNASPSSPFEIDLKADWNQVGNPYNFNISWEDVQAANPGLPGLRIYDGDFADGTRLDKMQGGFVKVTSAQKLKFPVVKNLSVNGRTDDEKYPLQNPLTSSDWQVALQLQHGTLTNRISGFGMNKRASEGFDEYDGFNMPRFFDTYLKLNHNKREGEDFYSKDIVPTSDNHVWEFFIETSSAERNIKLNWVNSYFGKNEKELYLFDVNLQRAIDMRKVTSYEFNKDNATSFKVVFGPPDFVKKEISVTELTLHSVWPNPSEGDVTVSFTLPELPSTQLIEFTVTDVLGKKLWSHQGDYESGYHELTWMRENKETNGLYIIHVQSGKTIKQARLVLK